jgi:uncharacterized membrane protein (GlpM family)
MLLSFALINEVVIKLVVCAAVVIAVAVAAERGGALVGGLVATLPTVSGPGYVFLALEHDANFIADSALSTFAITPVNAIAVLVFGTLARKHSLAASLLGSLSAWLAGALIVLSYRWTLPAACVANIVVMLACVAIWSRMTHAGMPPVRPRWPDLIARAFAVAVFITVIVMVSRQIGPFATGILINAPLLATGIAITLYHRVGGPAAAAVLANFVPGLIGFGLAVLTLHVSARPLGVPLALVVALGVSVSWNFLMWAIRARAPAPAG